MSHLELKGSRKAGHTTLSRRYHDPGGVQRLYICSLPDQTAQALRDGGTITIRLHQDAKPDQACWGLDVILNGETFKGPEYLSNDGFDLLLEAKDRFPVEIQGGELTMKKHKLILARHDLQRAEAAVEAALGKVSDIALEVRAMSELHPKLTLKTGDGKYGIVMQANGEAYATRYEKVWRDLTNSPLITALTRELHAAREKIIAQGKDSLGAPELPESYGEEKHLLHLSLDEGFEIIQDSKGIFFATRDGVEIDGLSGDKLAVTLAYELEEARAILSIDADLAAMPAASEAPGF